MFVQTAQFAAHICTAATGTTELTQKLVQLLLEKKGISGTTVPAVDFAAKKEREYDKLADLLREHLDMPKIYDILNSWGKTP